MKPMKKYQRDVSKTLAKLLWDKGIVQEPDKIDRTDDFLLHAPTGSGKTRICAETMVRIQGLADDHPFAPKISFVWFSSSDGRLWEQSMNAVNEVFQCGSELDVMTLDDLLAKGEFEENKCYFIPYNRVRSKSANTARGFGEKETLDSICAKPSNIKLIAFADEAHKDLGGENTAELPRLMHVCCLTQVTATPTAQINPARICAVDIDDAIAEGMIKREFRIQDLPDSDESRQITDEYLIEQTVKLQNMKKDVWAETEGVGIPKVLIQIAPDEGNKQKVKSATASQSEINTAKKIIPVLKKYGVPPEKIYVWLSEDEGGRGQYDGNNHPVDSTQFGKPGCDAEYLIFKNAVAHGWDCRDAATLLRLRQKGNISFNIQTFGRIGRSPNPDLKPEQLDHKYLYGADIITNDTHANIEAATAQMFSGKIKDVRNQNVCRIKEKFDAVAKKVAITAQGVSKPTYVPVDVDTLRDRLWDLLSSRMPVWSALHYERILVPKVQSRVINASQLWLLDKKESLNGARTYNPDIDDIESLFLQEAARGQGRNAINEIQNIIEEFAEGDDFKSIPEDAASITNIYERLMSFSEEFFSELRGSVMAGTSTEGKTFTYEYRIPASLRTELDVSFDNTNYLYDMSPDWADAAKNGLDSTQEIKIVNFLLGREDVLFWFKNGTGDYDFSIVYTRDKSVFGKKKADGKIHRFFPDFGVMMKNGTFIWIEGKGGIEQTGRNNEVDILDSACKSRDIPDYISHISHGTYVVQGINENGFVDHGIRFVNPYGVEYSYGNQLLYYKERKGYEDAATEDWGLMSDLFDELSGYPNIFPDDR